MGGGDWPTLLKRVYPDQGDLAPRVHSLLDDHRAGSPRQASEPWSERDAWLITYADQFGTPGEVPLRSLHRFYNNRLRPWINGVHILPFYPWSSDDGYSVVDYLAVNPDYGSWDDVAQLGRASRVMFDAVINHVSAESAWFKGYLAGDPAYRDFFIAVPPDTDLSAVVRPRTTPLLTEFPAADGPTHVWTTFSADQIDLNYRSPDLLMEVLRVLLEYAARGASMIRLDAIHFLWKEAGKSSVNMPEGHLVVQLLRAIMDEVYPDVLFVSETNVPHRENISYFGEGAREAQMVYQFALPPLVLDAMHTGKVDQLQTWIEELEPLPPGCTYFNFLSSHDGVGVRPVEGILPQHRIDDLVELNRSGGGQYGARTVGTSTAVYELNTTWFSLMETGHEPDEAVRRHLAAHAIMLALRGIPGIYALSLVGARSDQALYGETGRARSLNRTRFETPRLDQQLAAPESVTSQVMCGLETMLTNRGTSTAFHPDSPQRVIETPAAVLGIERGRAGALARVYVNTSGQPVTIDRLEPGWHWLGDGGAVGQRIELGPWESAWLANGA